MTWDEGCIDAMLCRWLHQYTSRPVKHLFDCPCRQGPPSLRRTANELRSLNGLSQVMSSQSAANLCQSICRAFRHELSAMQCPAKSLHSRLGEKLQERLARQASQRRDRSTEESLQIWKEMVAGSPVGFANCLRFRLDPSNNNGALRDPVAYRCNETPHLHTGTKYKVGTVVDRASSLCFSAYNMKKNSMPYSYSLPICTHDLTAPALSSVQLHHFALLESLT